MEGKFARFTLEDFAVVEPIDTESRRSLAKRVIDASEQCTKPVHIKAPQGHPIVDFVFADSYQVKLL